MRWNYDTLGRLLGSLPPAPSHVVERSKDLPEHVAGEVDETEPGDESGELTGEELRPDTPTPEDHPGSLSGTDDDLSSEDDGGEA